MSTATWIVLALIAAAVVVAVGAVAVKYARTRLRLYINAEVVAQCATIMPNPHKSEPAAAATDAPTEPDPALVALIANLVTEAVGQYATDHAAFRQLMAAAQYTQVAPQIKRMAGDWAGGAVVYTPAGISADAREFKRLWDTLLRENARLLKGEIEQLYPELPYLLGWIMYAARHELITRPDLSLSPGSRTVAA